MFFVSLNLGLEQDSLLSEIDDVVLWLWHATTTEPDIYVDRSGILKYKNITYY